MSENLENTESTEPVATDEPLTPEQALTKNLTEKLLEAENKYKYLYAEFENFKKRAIKERQDAMKFGWENVAGELINVLDNFDRALQHAKPGTDPGLLDGLKMISNQFLTAMSKQGVAEVAALHQAFNPELHEAIGQVPHEKPAGTIIEEQLKGYTLHGRLLRASRVLVSSGNP